MPSKLTQFSPEFIEKCFVTWYSTPQRPAEYGQIARILPKDEMGRQPSRTTVIKWFRIYGWGERADKLDAKVIAKVETTLINKKAYLLQHQAEKAFALAGKAHDHLMTGTFDSSAAAVNAYFRATEEVRKVIGLSDLLQRLGEMSDEEVQEEIKRRLIRASDAEQVIDLEEDIGGDSHEETS